MAPNLERLTISDLYTIMMSLSVWCLVIDHDRTPLTNPAAVVCDPGLNINDLKIKVKELVPEWLKDQSIFSITVFHSPNINSEMRTVEWKTALSTLDFASADVPPAKLVTKAVSGNELLIFRKSAPRTSLERPPTASNVGDEFSVLKRTRIASLSPSAFARPSTFKANQDDPIERVLDDRPCPDAKVAPISLLYRPFGEFEDVLTSGIPPPDIPVNLFGMEANVNNLITAMSLFYPSEAEQRDAGIRLLDSIFKLKLLGCDIDGVWTEGRCDANGLITTIADFKTSFKAFPHVQMACNVARSHVALNRVEKLCGRYRIPALGISFTGDFVQFHAIMLLGHQYRVVGLTSPLSCSLAETNALHKKEVYRAFIAAHVLQQRIHRDLESYAQANLVAHPQFFEGEYLFPAVTQLRQDEHGDKYINFRILDYYAGSGDKDYEQRHIYHARVTQPGHTHDSQDILVKFSRRYSIELHKFCSDEGHAPAILGFEQLPGGWFGIAMEYLAGAALLTSRLSSDQDELLQGLVKGFHTKGLVHGDLRAANILCNEEGNKFWLIDFDWGGKAGEVTYPTWLLDKELRIGRQSNDLVIRQEDDERVLRATLQYLRSN